MCDSRNDKNNVLFWFFQEGESITKRRTAASSALSARWLAPKTPRILAILGSGHQALAHMQVLLAQYNQSISKVRVSDNMITAAEPQSSWLILTSIELSYDSVPQKVSKIGKVKFENL